MGKSWIDDTHYRETSDDGTKSTVYETGGFLSSDRPVEYADHNSDGTTDAYHVDDSFFGIVLSGGRGTHK
jgi:hypothetical protein